MIRLAVHVTPRSGAAAIEGVREGVLHVRVRAAPEDGAANEAVLRLLADTLLVPRSALSLVSGARSRRKLIGLDAGLRQRVDAMWPGLVR